VGEPVLAVLYAAALWWLSTGLILRLDRLPRRTFRWSLAGASLLALAALAGLAWSRDADGPAAAYLAFTCGLVVWGWNETAFLLGYLTGPRVQASPPGSGPGRRFLHAVQAILWHELALLASGGIVLVLVWGGSNPTGLWVLVLLWLLRTSAKLNLHLGVPNPGDELLPDHLRHLASFFARRPMNGLFPVSVTLATLALAHLVGLAVAAPEQSLEAVATSLLAALLALGLLEHWLMVLPIPETALWGWALGERPPASTPLLSRGHAVTRAQRRAA
jgi:putative photosynthetic complex assembly protein 2